MKRKTFTKKQRKEIALKTNNKCGYCGEELKSGWHIDHMEAFVARFYNGKQEQNDNFMASCPQCNNYKRFDTVEQFRTKLEDQHRLAKNQSVNYRFALKFNQIIETPKQIIFYFEELTKTH